MRPLILFLLLRTPAGRLLATFPGHTQTVTGVAFSPDGKYILTASQDGTVMLRAVRED